MACNYQTIGIVKCCRKKKNGKTYQPGMLRPSRCSGLSHAIPNGSPIVLFFASRTKYQDYDKLHDRLRDGQSKRHNNSGNVNLAILCTDEDGGEGGEIDSLGLVTVRHLYQPANPNVEMTETLGDIRRAENIFSANVIVTYLKT